MSQETPLQSTLNALRQVALTGRFEDLPALCSRLKAQIDDFARDPPDDTAAIHAEANDLMRLLQASGQGLKAAHDRLSEIAKIRQGGGVYGDNGQRRQLALPKGDSRRL